MKKIIGLVMISATLLLSACGNETQPAATTPPAPAKEVIVVNPAPAPTVIVKEAPAKSTTITLDKNGVKVGTKKVDVEIKKDNK